MRDQIVEKLNLEIRSGLNTEPKALYLMAEIRKMIEIQNSKSSWPYLNFYCNWVLHSSLDRDVAKEILNLFDLYHIAHSTGQNDKTLENWIDEITRMTKLREDLSSFLIQNHISDFTKTSEQWEAFIAKYSKVIEDTPLEISANSSSQIKKIKIKAEEAAAEDNATVSRITWIVTDLAGNEKTIPIYNTYGIGP